MYLFNTGFPSGPGFPLLPLGPWFNVEKTVRFRKLPYTCRTLNDKLFMSLEYMGNTC